MYLRRHSFGRHLICAWYYIIRCLLTYRGIYILVPCTRGRGGYAPHQKAPPLFLDAIFPSDFLFCWASTSAVITCVCHVLVLPDHVDPWNIMEIIKFMHVLRKQSLILQFTVSYPNPPCSFGLHTRSELPSICDACSHLCRTNEISYHFSQSEQIEL
jgi:hypothetical protein